MKNYVQSPSFIVVGRYPPFHFCGSRQQSNYNNFSLPPEASKSMTLTVTLCCSSISLYPRPSSHLPNLQSMPPSRSEAYHHGRIDSNPIFLSVLPPPPLYGQARDAGSTALTGNLKQMSHRFSHDSSLQPLRPMINTGFLHHIKSEDFLRPQNI